MQPIADPTDGIYKPSCLRSVMIPPDVVGILILVLVLALVYRQALQ
jgi:hypothetical protein